MANDAAPQQNGHSIVIDGIAYDRPGNSRDMLLVGADEQEGIYLASFDLAALRDYRCREVWGNAFRHPIWSALRTRRVGGTGRAA